MAVAHEPRGELSLSLILHSGVPLMCLSLGNYLDAKQYSKISGSRKKEMNDRIREILSWYTSENRVFVPI